MLPSIAQELRSNGIISKKKIESYDSTGPTYGRQPEGSGGAGGQLGTRNERGTQGHEFTALLEYLSGY